MRGLGRGDEMNYVTWEMMGRGMGGNGRDELMSLGLMIDSWSDGGIPELEV
jgi:hypothetical protein